MGSALPTTTLQAFLARHSDPLLKVDGVAGPHTAAALSHFLDGLPQRPIASLGQVMASDDFEGLDSPPDWPGAESGVTIGLGYDLGYELNFAEDWGHRLSEDDFRALSKTIGLKGHEAGEAAKELHHIKVTLADAIAVFHDSTAVRYVNLVTMVYPGWQLLAPETQIALFSLVYNRGASLNGADRINMRAIRPMVLNGDYVGISAQLLGMIHIWEGSAIASDMHRRRTAESDLCLFSYFRQQLAGLQAQQAADGEKAVGIAQE